MTREAGRAGRGRRAAARAAALAVVIAAHVALLYGLPFGSAPAPLPAAAPSDHAITLTLDHERPLAPSPAHALAQSAARAPQTAKPPSPPTAPAATPTAVQTTAAPPSAAPSGDQSSGQASGPPAALTAALRGSVVGCANADLAGLSDREREGCRQRFAAGGRDAPYLSPVPSVKLAYYDALAKAEDDWHSGRDPGHLPFIVCRSGGRGSLVHALKIGPCYLEPPKGSLDIDADSPSAPEHDPGTMRHGSE